MPKSGVKNRSSKHDKFHELAEARTNKALDAIRRIGNLANRQNYDFDDEEVRKIMKALRDGVSEAEARFKSPKGNREARFKL
jgi:hypothetical protein